MKSEPAASGDATPEAVRTPIDMRLMRSLLIGIFIFMTIYGLYFGREFFMPVILAFMLALMLTPIVRTLRKRGIPEAISATLLVLLSVLCIGATGYFMSGPVMDLVNDAPAIGRQLTERLAELRHPFERMMQVSRQVEEVADTAQQPGVQKVVLAQPGIVSQAAGNLLSAATTVAITFVLSLFLMASGTMFYEKIVQSFARMSEKKRALRVVYDVEREISRYLLTVALINGGLGVAIGLGLWAVGVPNPFVWGVASALLNFLPYVGAITGVVIVGAVSFVTFETLAQAAIVPLVYISLTTLEGQIVTPLVVGRRLEINTVAIFTGIAFWGWLWGLVGVLLAVPILVIVKQIAEHLPSWNGLSEFLSSGVPHDDHDDEEEPKRSA